MVPFNGPHKLKVESVSSKHLKVKLPYRKKNLNHLNGLHACAMATLAEVCSGLLLISNLNPKKYRLILQKLDMEYFYQGKTNAYGEFNIEGEWWKEKVTDPIEKEGVINVLCPVKIVDEQANHLATGTAHWQVKEWEKVKTK